MKLTLHIGTPKTATTTVQHSLAASRNTLLENGLLYPGPLSAHHEWKDILDQIAGGKTRFGTKLEALVDGLAQEAAASGAPHVLMSSESFIIAERDVIGALRAALMRALPALSGISVLCYVREPISFATSHGQQLIKAGRVRLDDYFQKPWPIDLTSSFTAFSEVFGRENIHVRSFSPDAFVGGSVVSDFMDALGLGDVQLDNATGPLNQSTSYEGVLVADALNAMRPRAARLRRMRRDYKKIIEAIPGQKFVLPTEVQKRVIAQSAADRAMLMDWFGIDLKPARVQSASPPAIGPEILQWIAETIDAHVQCADSLKQEQKLRRRLEGS